MRYYTDSGNGIARLLTDARSGPELLNAQAQFWNFKHNDWVDAIAGKDAEILFSGNYDSCTEAHALQQIERSRLKRDPSIT